MTADSIAQTASLSLNRSPYSKGAEKLAADLDATEKPATSPTFYRSRTDSHGQGCIVEEGTGRTVAVVYDADKDADLLSAAPDLLNGCRAALAYLAEPASKYPENRAEAVRIIRAAIAKATGK